MLGAFALTAVLPGTAAFFALTYTDQVTDALAVGSAAAGALMLTLLHTFRSSPRSKMRHV